jgi:tRNA-dihydrouridine synthase C
MEGLVDDILRDVLTRVGGIDWCVTEFIRSTISCSRLPISTSSARNCSTVLAPFRCAAARAVVGFRSGVPGGKRALACELGSEVIDLNFGCPAKTVNKSRGGAVLLKEPELLNHRRTCASRRAGAHSRDRQDAPGLRQPGWLAGVRHGAGRRRRCAHRGACTTKVDGYKPPAHWEWIPRVQDVVKVPVFANGDIWSVEDWRRCREISGVEDIMLGRGLVSRPDLARQIAAARAGEEVVEMTWAELLPLIQDFWLQARRDRLANRRAV